MKIIFLNILNIVFFGVLICLGSCSYFGDERDGAPVHPVDTSTVPDAVPRDEPKSKYGNPDSYVVFGKRYYVMNDSAGFRESGIASWYGKKFHGKRTSSGETYDMYAMTAAHKSLPLPTYVEVKNLENNRKIIVKVNDRGPFHANRVIDLSYTAAQKLGIIEKGTGLVEIRALSSNYYAENTASNEKVAYQSAKSGFYIQVGAYSQQINAEKMRNNLQDIVEKLVSISQVVVSDKVLYRVRIGPLFNIENADNIVSQLVSMGIDDHHIVFD